MLRRQGRADRGEQTEGADLHDAPSVVHFAEILCIPTATGMTSWKDYRAGYALQRATDWHNRRPPM